MAFATHASTVSLGTFPFHTGGLELSQCAEGDHANYLITKVDHTHPIRLPSSWVERPRAKLLLWGDDFYVEAPNIALRVFKLPEFIECDSTAGDIAHEISRTYVEKLAPTMRLPDIRRLRLYALHAWVQVAANGTRTTILCADFRTPSCALEPAPESAHHATNPTRALAPVRGPYAFAPFRQTVPTVATSPSFTAHPPSGFRPSDESAMFTDYQPANPPTSYPYSNYQFPNAPQGTSFDPDWSRSAIHPF